MQMCPKCGRWMCYHLEQYHHYYTCNCGYDTRTQRVMYTTTTTKQDDLSDLFYTSSKDIANSILPKEERQKLVEEYKHLLDIDI